MANIKSGVHNEHSGRFGREHESRHFSRSSSASLLMEGMLPKRRIRLVNPNFANGL